MINDIDEQINTGNNSLFSFVDLDKETWQLCLRYLFMKYKYLFSHTELKCCSKLELKSLQLVFFFLLQRNSVTEFNCTDWT